MMHVLPSGVINDTSNNNNNNCALMDDKNVSASLPKGSWGFSKINFKKRGTWNINYACIAS